MSSKNKTSTAYLIDSTAFVLKYWFVIPPIKTKNYESVSAFMGFMNFVIKFLEENKPQRICFAFDESLGTCFRNKLYKKYKYNRDMAPDELKIQFQLSRKFLDLLGIKNFASKEFEADDIIYTIANINRKFSIINIIITNDKDLYQIIEDDDIWWNLSNKKYRFNDLKKILSFSPKKIPDFIGFAGDRVDGIPGAPGIGTKTATTLLEKFGSVEKVFDNLEKQPKSNVLSKRIEKILVDNKKIIYLSKKLATLKYIDKFKESSSISNRQKFNIKKIKKFLENVGISKNQISNIENKLSRLGT